MENFKNKLIDLINQLLNFLIRFFQASSTFLMDSLEKRNLQKQKNLEQIQHQRILNFALQVSHELCAVMKGCSYSYIQDIRSPRDFRMGRRQIQNGTLLQEFILRKSVDLKLSASDLSGISPTINHDIQRYAYETRLYNGEEYLFYTFPVLYHGVRVISASNGIHERELVLLVQAVLF